MVLSNHNTGCLLALLASCTVLASTPYAQTSAPQIDTSQVVQAPYRSAFDGYRPHTEEAIANWKAANDTVARIGGWREYARQAQTEDPALTPAAEPDAKPAAKAAP